MHKPFLAVLLVCVLLSNSAMAALPPKSPRPMPESIFSAQAFAARPEAMPLHHKDLAVAVIGMVMAIKGAALAGIPSLIQEGTKAKLAEWGVRLDGVRKWIAEQAPEFGVFMIEDAGVASGNRASWFQAFLQGRIPTALIGVLSVVLWTIGLSSISIVPIFLVLGFGLLFYQSQFVGDHDNLTQLQYGVRWLATIVLLNGTAFGSARAVATSMPSSFSVHPVASLGVILVAVWSGLIFSGVTHDRWNRFWRWRGREDLVLTQNPRVPEGNSLADIALNRLQKVEAHKSVWTPEGPYVADLPQWLAAKSPVEWQAGPRYGLAKAKAHFDQVSGYERVQLIMDKTWASAFPELGVLYEKRRDFFPSAGSLVQLWLSTRRTPTGQILFMIDEVQQPRNFTKLSTRQRHQLGEARRLAVDLIAEWAHAKGYIVAAQHEDFASQRMPDVSRQIIDASYRGAYANRPTWVPVRADILEYWRGDQRWYIYQPYDAQTFLQKPSRASQLRGIGRRAA